MLIIKIRLRTIVYWVLVSNESFIHSTFVILRTRLFKYPGESRVRAVIKPKYQCYYQQAMLQFPEIRRINVPKQILWCQ